MRFLRNFCAAALVLFGGVPAWADFDPVDYFDGSVAPVYYTATAGQNDFSIPWAFEDDADIVVLTTTDTITGNSVSWSTRTLTTHYTITGEGGNSGTLSFTDTGCEAGSDDTEGCTVGTVVLIYRDDEPNRTADFGSTISSEALNRNFDRLTVWVQENNNILSRQALKLPITDKDKDVTLEPMTPNDAGHAVVVNPEADDFLWSRNSLDDWGCLECPGGDPDTGVCDGGANDGLACEDDSDCPDGNCDNGTCDGGTNDGETCDTDADCPGGLCDPGICVGGSNNGEPCEEDADCPDGYCGGDGNDSLLNCDYLGTDSEGVLVCNVGSCPEACGSDGGGDPGQCVGGENDGELCTDEVACPDGTCDGDADCLDCPADDPGTCHTGTDDGEACTDNADCAGVCTASACVGGTDSGSACTTNGDCEGICGGECDGGSNDEGSCDEDADCPGGGVCQILWRDNAVLRWDAVGKKIQGSNTTLGDSGTFQGLSSLVYNEPGGEGECSGGSNDGDPCYKNADCPGGGTCFPIFVQWGGRPTTSDATAIYGNPLQGPAYLVDNGLVDADAAMLMTVQSPAGGSPLAIARMALRQSTYPITVFIPGAVPAAQEYRFYFAEPVNCPDDFAGSIGKAITAFTGTDAWTLKKNTSSIGTATPSTSTFAFATTGGKTEFATGDYLSLTTATNADATGADVSFTFDCVKTFVTTTTTSTTTTTVP